MTPRGPSHEVIGELAPSARTISRSRASSRRTRAITWPASRSATIETISPKMSRAITSGSMTRWAVADDADFVGEMRWGKVAGRSLAISDCTAVTTRGPPDTCTKEMVGSTQQVNSGRVKAGVAKIVGLRSVSSTTRPALVMARPTTLTLEYTLARHLVQLLVDWALLITPSSNRSPTRTP
jgi:hypothetical protein